MRKLVRRAAASGIATASLGVAMVALAPMASALDNLTDEQVFKVCQGDTEGINTGITVENCDYDPTTPKTNVARHLALPTPVTNNCDAAEGEEAGHEEAGQFTRTRSWTVGGSLGGGAELTKFFGLTVAGSAEFSQGEEEATITNHTFEVAPGQKARGILIEPFYRTSGNLVADVTYTAVYGFGAGTTFDTREEHREIFLTDVEFAVPNGDIEVAVERKPCGWPWEPYWKIPLDRYIDKVTSR
ncbi:hypothetical protein [Quadrisphaera sp. DSM 44207]|uniref:hypothetical protein n=1 Tax=Quadrisphaera sp. DSM 44207 TaxID=1881057 RepID=UPI00088C0AB8|nr:hypothetical protein [Quadrisphaera sp. DSM 44207]SDQ35522.1 hypothetical protein SAMN05428996_1376 [Quadrisphaera sp. DSM 44207]